METQDWKYYYDLVHKYADYELLDKQLGAYKITGTFIVLLSEALYGNKEWVIERLNKMISEQDIPAKITEENMNEHFKPA